MLQTYANSDSFFIGNACIVNVSGITRAIKAFDNKGNIFKIEIFPDPSIVDYMDINELGSIAWALSLCKNIHLTYGVYPISKTIELSDTSLNSHRKSTSLTGPAVIKPIAEFTGSYVVRHSQTVDQAAALSFGYGADLTDIELDGSCLHSANVNGIRFDGAWQPVWKNVYVHNMTGNGWEVPADNSLDAAGDDSYGNVAPVIISCRFAKNHGWGIRQTRFSGSFSAIGTWVNNNLNGGVQLTSPNVLWLHGSISYNGGVGLRLTKSLSAINSQLSSCTFVSTEFDRNAVNNVWFEHAYNCSIENSRLITAETGEAFNGGEMIAPVLVKFGGSPGMSSFNNCIDQPYVRDSQQTSNPSLTLFEFNPQASYCRVEHMHHLSNGTTNVTIGTADGESNFVTDLTGSCVIGDDTLSPTCAIAILTNATKISTVLTDIIFNIAEINKSGRYNTATGIYSFGADNGLFLIEGFLTVDAAAAMTGQTVAIHLRHDDGSSIFSSVKIMTTQIQVISKVQTIPFRFTLQNSIQNARVKLSIVASTETSLKVGSQYSQLLIVKLT